MRINRCVCLCQRNGGESGGHRRVGARWGESHNHRHHHHHHHHHRVWPFFFALSLSISSMCPVPLPSSLFQPFRSLSFSLFLSLRRCVRNFYQLLRTPGARLCWWPCRRSARDVCTNGVYNPENVVCRWYPMPTVFFSPQRRTFCSLFLACRGH